MGVIPADVVKDKGSPAGGVNLLLPPKDHIHTINCDQAQYGPIYDSVETPVENNSSAVVV